VAWLRAHTSTARAPVALGASEELTLPADADDAALTERVVSLGDIGLFGITTEPAGPSRGPLLVLINVANDRHVGPGRRWVDCARDWAGMGFRVLRMDQSGTGDSPSHRGQEFGTLYAREWLEDLPSALRSGPCADTDVALISLCSGAYSSMESAFQVPVAEVYAINVILHAKVMSTASELYDERRLAARPPISPLLRLSRRFPRAASLLWSMYRELAVHNAPMAAVAALVRRGTRVVLIMSPQDGRHFKETLFWTAFRAPKMRRAGMFRLLIDHEIDHTLMTQEGQRRVIAAITSDLLSRHPLPSGASAVPSREPAPTKVEAGRALRQEAKAPSSARSLAGPA
jgi:hypothetical protein